MYDYGKVQTFLHQKGEKLSVPEPTPPSAPTKFNPKRIWAWDDVMKTIDFSSCDGENPRWIYTHSPETGRIGVTIIVYLEEGRWLMNYNIDLVSTENDADWESNIEAPNDCTTPFTVAVWAKKYVRESLEAAVQTLLLGK